MSRHEAQQKSTPIKCEAAIAILASEGLALVWVSRQHARGSFLCLIRVRGQSERAKTAQSLEKAPIFEKSTHSS